MRLITTMRLALIKPEQISRFSDLHITYVGLRHIIFLESFGWEVFDSLAGSRAFFQYPWFMRRSVKMLQRKKIVSSNFRGYGGSAKLTNGQVAPPQQIANLVLGCIDSMRIEKQDDTPCSP